MPNCVWTNFQNGEVHLFSGLSTFAHSRNIRHNVFFSHHHTKIKQCNLEIPKYRGMGKGRVAVKVQVRSIRSPELGSFRLKCGVPMSDTYELGFNLHVHPAL